MANPTLCNACQGFLRGDCRMVDPDPDRIFLKYAWLPGFEHHNTTESFQLSLQLQCVICTHLWAALQPESARDPYKELTVNGPPSLGPTIFQSCFPDEYIYREPAFRFYRGTHSAVLTLYPCNDAAGAEPTDQARSTTGDANAMQFLVEQYQSSDHDIVNYPLSFPSAYVPTRLLDVLDATSPVIRLRAREHLPKPVPYIALSHCWGKVTPVTLTRRSLASLQTGIAIDSLPKTFRDAIAVTRTLNHRYIWIDCLCIIQDDASDWSAEAPTMTNVYSNATLCIAATAASNSSMGLFFERDPPILVKAIMGDRYHGEKRDSRDRHKAVPHATYRLHKFVNRAEDIEAAPLNQRAWVAQERFLSPRIIHFTRDMLYWEYMGHVNSEVYPRGHQSHESLFWKLDSSQDALRMKASISQIRHDQVFLNACNDSVIADSVSVREDWRVFRNFYTTCYLTDGKDALVALDGVARSVGPLLRDNMFFGMWTNDWINQLCWHTSTTDVTSRRPAFPLAPSWSWVSSTRPVQERYNGEGQKGEFSPAGAVVTNVCDPATSRSSERAAITVLCVPIRLRLWVRSKGIFMTELPRKLSGLTAGFFSDEVTAPDAYGSSGLKSYFLPLRWQYMKGNKGLPTAGGLLVTPCDEQSGTYMRYGYCELTQSYKATDDAPHSAFRLYCDSATKESIVIV